MKKIKTITLWENEQPDVTLLPGHKVTVKEFNDAFKAEEWSTDRIYRNQLFLEYWRKDKKVWVKSSKDDKKAKPYTVMHW